jgi:hypothetical protein
VSKYNIRIEQDRQAGSDTVDSKDVQRAARDEPEQPADREISNQYDRPEPHRHHVDELGKTLDKAMDE